MYAPTTNMDGERYQDLSELGWFGSEVQPWAAAEGPTTMDVEMHSYGNSQPELAYETSIDYSPTELGPFYSLPRTDSMEDVKAVTAPMEVVPMRQHEAIQVKDFVKTETEDVIAKEEVIEGENDLLAEFGNGDLFDFIFSEGSPLEENKTLSAQSQEPNCKTSAPAEQPKTLPQTTTLTFPQQSKTSSPTPSVSPPLQKNKAMKETYLAIPRELTSDGNKIPKMLILKTPQTSTINFQEMGLSIAERIKIGDKRKRPKKYSDYDHSNDDDDSNEDSNDIDYDAAEDEEHLRPSKRSRRSSTSSTTSDRYRELRDKNNEASRKSRLNRKEKEKDLMNSLSAVEGENHRLKTKSDELERLVHSLRKLLLQIVVSRGSVR